ncbi:MAG: hypothetical protein HQM16_09455 [Deltaproteobacteria bacterium]|nr:hypothetical protein [Deltaproteobacteria bacterium]
MHQVAKVHGIIGPENVDMDDMIEVMYPEDMFTAKQCGNTKARKLPIDTVAEYTEFARRLEHQVNVVSNGRRQPRHVIYPFAGFDLATAVAAFREAETYVIIDQYPFLKITDLDALPTEVGACGHRGHDVGTVMEADVELFSNQAGGILPLILARMRQYYEGFKVKHIQYFVEGERPSNRVFCSPDELTCHGIMSFELGDGTATKTLFFVNTNIFDRNMSTLFIGSCVRHMGIALDLSFVDGWVVKGTMNNLTQGGGVANIKESLIEIIRQNRGVVVEGRAASPEQYGELWEQDSVFPAGTQIHNDPHFLFSYHRGLRVVWFKQGPTDEVAV